MKIRLEIGTEASHKKTQQLNSLPIVMDHVYYYRIAVISRTN